MKITFVIPRLSSCGGIERVLTIQANYLVRSGHEVAVLVFDDADAPFFPLDERVQKINLVTTGRRFYGKLSQCLQIRRVITAIGPDVTISIFRNSITILSLLGSGLPVIGTEHMNPARALKSTGQKFLQRLAYPCARRIVSVSRGVDDAYAWLPAAKRSVIPNPLEFTMQPQGNPVAHAANPYILAVGRFVAQKGFDLLVQAFARIAGDYPDWKLCIVGGVPDDSFRQLIVELGIEDKCLFPGVVNNIGAFMQHAGLFVLSSRHEAFPMVLIEAMAHGLPVVAADCPYGPGEIIHNGINGILAKSEDIGSLADGMRVLLGNMELRNQLASQARSITDVLSVDHVMSEWSRLLNQVIHEKDTARTMW